MPRLPADAAPPLEHRTRPVGRDCEPDHAPRPDIAVIQPGRPSVYVPLVLFSSWMIQWPSVVCSTAWCQETLASLRTTSPAGSAAHVVCPVGIHHLTAAVRLDDEFRSGGIRPRSHILEFTAAGRARLFARTAPLDKNRRSRYV